MKEITVSPEKWRIACKLYSADKILSQGKAKGYIRIRNKLYVVSGGMLDHYWDLDEIVPAEFYKGQTYSHQEMTGMLSAHTSDLRRGDKWRSNHQEGMKLTIRGEKFVKVNGSIRLQKPPDVNKKPPKQLSLFGKGD